MQILDNFYAKSCILTEIQTIFLILHLFLRELLCDKEF